MTRALITALFLIFAAPATAQMVCGDHSKMVGFLDRDYRESRSGLGLTASGAVVELYTARSGTWTMLITEPGGNTCVMGNGEGWDTQKMPKRIAGEI